MVALPGLDGVSHSAVRDLVKRYRAGDEKALREIRRRSDVNPVAVARAVIIDLGWIARETWVQRRFEKDPVKAIGIEARLTAIARQLSGTNPTVARLLAVEAVLFAYLEHWEVSLEAAAAKCTNSELIPRQNAAQTRYLRALKALTASAAVEGWKQTADVAVALLSSWSP
jgi:hypothetical protein